MKVKSKKDKPQIYEDVWIPTQCHRCQAECGILAHRVNGVVVKLEGDPNSSVGSYGGLCPKGLAGLQLLYDPNRLKVPLRRANPRKGIGVDPEWKEISWDEALSEIAAKLKKAADIDPGRVMIQIGISSSTQIVPLFLGKLMMTLASPKGLPVPVVSSGAHCGNAGHFINALNYAAFVNMPDYKYCNYLLQWGTNFGQGGFMQYANRLAAEALNRGMKMVVFDPVCNYAASKASEWLPIIPGTDAAVALAMINVIVNDLGIYDAAYLKHKTNAPYLIGQDGRYVRDGETHKPLIWDSAASKARTFDDKSVADFDLDYTHEVNGIRCRPAWMLFKEHFKQFTPEKAAEISGVPSETVRRIATEFAGAAMVGSTITIDGKQLPYRPVAIQHIRAAVTHKNATHTVFALDLLLHVLGAANTPGGMVSSAVECHGHPHTGLPYLGVAACPDGFVTIGGKWLFEGGGFWPMKEPVYPNSKELTAMFPAALEVPIWGAIDRDELLQKAKVDPAVDVIMNYCSNSVMNAANPRDKAEFLKRVPFIVDFEIFPTEFNEGFADIVLPDTCYLEYMDWSGIQHPYHNQTPAVDEPWCFHITQKVVEPQYGRRHAPQVLDDILDRMGCRAKLNAYYNHLAGFRPELELKPDDKIAWEDLCDRVARQHFG
ncbi:MAG TPA: molybdopterin-dependent oxidoreductase, partial [Dehalococcoidia bacterium]|nr:molybdopterin-dependent oxidoreductase [Dehalococcoidia bacterium]